MGKKSKSATSFFSANFYNSTYFENPAYYELLLDNHYTGGAGADVLGFLARRAPKR